MIHWTLLVALFLGIRIIGTKTLKTIRITLYTSTITKIQVISTCFEFGVSFDVQMVLNRKL